MRYMLVLLFSVFALTACGTLKALLPVSEELPPPGVGWEESTIRGWFVKKSEGSIGDARTSDYCHQKISHVRQICDQFGQNISDTYGCYVSQVDTWYSICPGTAIAEGISGGGGIWNRKGSYWLSP